MKGTMHTFRIVPRFMILNFSLPPLRVGREL